MNRAGRSWALARAGRTMMMIGGGGVVAATLAPLGASVRAGALLVGVLLVVVGALLTFAAAKRK